MRTIRMDIQALRGLAVLFVVAYHAGLPGLSAGYLGVDLFFVISGFLITGIIARAMMNKDFSFSEFYYRRACRLLPAAYVVIAGVILIAPMVLSPSDLEDLSAQVVGAVTFSANVILYQQTGYFDGAAELKPLLHFWSLAVEEQYYIAMPLLLLVVPRKHWVVAVSVVTLASFGLSIYAAPRHQDFAFYLPLTRAWELGLGSLGAIAAARLTDIKWISSARLPAVAILLVIPFFPVDLPHPGIDALLVCVATLIILAGPTGHPAETSAPVRVLGHVGDISYSLYLVHWPLIVFTKVAYMGHPPGHAVAVAVAASFGASILLYRFVETPFRTGALLSRSTFVSGLVAVSLLIAIAPVLSFSRGSGSDLAFDLRRNYGLDPSCAEIGREFTGISALCRTSANPEVIIWGDSYAMMWAKALGDQLSARGIGLAQATMPRCYPWPSAAISPADASLERRDADLACMRFNRAVFDHILSNPTLRVVFLSSPFASPVSRRAILLRQLASGVEEQALTEDMSLRAFVETINTLRAAGKEVVVIAPPPSVDFDAGDCQSRIRQGTLVLGAQSDCAILEEEWRSYRSRTISWIEKAEKASKVKTAWPSNVTCLDGECATAIGPTILYQDNGHLTYKGSALLAEKMGLADAAATVVQSSVSAESGQ